MTAVYKSRVRAVRSEARARLMKLRRARLAKFTGASSAPQPEFDPTTMLPESLVAKEPPTLEVSLAAQDVVRDAAKSSAALGFVPEAPVLANDDHDSDALPEPMAENGEPALPILADEEADMTEIEPSLIEDTEIDLQISVDKSPILTDPAQMPPADLSEGGSPMPASPETVDARDADPECVDQMPDEQDFDTPLALTAQNHALVTTDPGASPAMPTDLYLLPGIGPGLIWLFARAGVHSLDDLAAADAERLEPRLGLVGRLLDLDGWIEQAQHLSRRRAQR